MSKIPPQCKHVMQKLHTPTHPHTQYTQHPTPHNTRVTQQMWEHGGSLQVQKVNMTRVEKTQLSMADALGFWY